MQFEVYKTDSFYRTFETLENDEKEWIRKMTLQLRDNPRTGKPLKFSWFREKKYRGKRLYFIVYEDFGKILFVAFGDKKEQQKIIDSILRNLDAFKKLAERL